MTFESPSPPPSSSSPTPLPPGLLVLQGNRLEWLLEALLDWLGAHPLAPLETETVLVQSNGIAEWLKMALAQRAGVCAATRVELPARFLWRLYRGVLGREGAPARSPLDEAPLAWRLMRLLPQLAPQPGYAPLAQFLAAGQDENAAEDLPRRLQLARKLADLYDQYQVYRADWLHAWRAGEAVLIDARGQRSPLPEEQRWQALLWQALCAELDEAQAAGVRSEVHARAVAALDAAAEGGAALSHPLPRRVVVFGVSHLPQQTLEALGALARHAQVLLAVPNPCRYHWADVIEGRELLGRPRALRQAHRGGVDLGELPLEAAHAQANPLLAAWGRQARDFLRLLDHFDETQAHARTMALPRVDLFDEAPGSTLLAQLQARIRDNLSAAEPLEGAEPPPPADRSIVFHVAHSAMREVEVLHDALLDLLAQPPGGEPLAPRDIVVMLPDIEPWAPLIHAVFGRHAPGDARRIPYEIADLRARARAPLLRALEWLLRVDEQRCTASELRDLLEVPALARRFGLDDEGREVAARWLAGAGVRWGLDAAQRAHLGLGACGELNTWRFGLRRMLLGYAVGRDDGAAEAGEGDWQDIAPYDEVGGLEAVVAGSLAALVDALTQWWARAGTPATPADWGPRCQALLRDFFDPADEEDRLLQVALQEALARWQDDCEAAGYDEPVPLAVLREAWLAGVDEPGLRSRFLAGGVVFCTLMPMRAIPFPVVALLGMNDGDYPRRSPRSDFDLIGAPGQRRPGDRARRDDDRLLMLEAVLAARRVLHISWSGRSLRDNTVQPPSVLVAQLRDAIAASWGPERLAALTTEHPLQPFSRGYFEAGSALHTWAREWRAAHEAPAATAVPTVAPGSARLPLDLKRLETWLRRPVAAYWRERLGVTFTPLSAALQDDEPLALDALDETLLLQDLVAGPGVAEPAHPAQMAERLAARVGRLARRGVLPLGALSERWQRHFQATAQPMLAQWSAWQAEWPQPAKPLRIVWHDRPAPHESPRLLLDDWLDGLRQAGDGQPVWPQLVARKLARPRKKAGRDGAIPPPELRPEQFLGAWLRLCVAAAQGVAVQGRLVGRDVVATLSPPDADEARAQLDALLAAWQQGQRAPLPVALRTALAFLQTLADSDGDGAAADRAAGLVYDDARGTGLAEGLEPALARCWPDWEHLAAEPWPTPDLDARLAAVMAPPVPHRAPAFGAWAERLYEPLRLWVRDHVRAQWLAGGDAANDQDDEEDAGEGDA